MLYDSFALRFVIFVSHMKSDQLLKVCHCVHSRRIDSDISNVRKLFIADSNSVCNVTSNTDIFCEWQMSCSRNEVYGSNRCDVSKLGINHLYFIRGHIMSSGT